MTAAREALAAYIRDRQARTPSIAEVVPYLIAVEEIRALTHGRDVVASADICAILDAVDLVERGGR